jgi:hypothetical protein
MIATIFYHPMNLPVRTVLWLVIPLCLSVVIVYKTVRTDNLRRLPLQILFLAAYVLAGLVALGVCLYLIQEYWP